MNDKRIIYIWLILLAKLLLSSCAQEEPTGRGATAEDEEILFYTSLPGVETRTDVIIDNTSIERGFYVSAGNLEDVDANGKPSVFFEDEKVEQTTGMGDAFRSDKCKWPANKGEKDGKLRFFAFFPSFKVLRESAGLNADDKQYFIMEYSKVKNKSVEKYEYCIKKFKVNEDISKHSDFVTATVDGSKTDNLYSGVSLALQHQLSRLNLEAYGKSESFDVEIAGVRIGGLALVSDFSFEGKPDRDTIWNNTRVGRWTGVIETKGCVEYIFREEDTVVSINQEKTPNFSNSVSIMGNGGRAMVIPYDYNVWNYLNSQQAANGKDYLYFSVLLRVKERATGNKTLLYPYIEGVDMTSKVNTDNMHIVYLSIDTVSNSGKVMKRVYRNKEDKKFYIDPSFSKVYNKPDEEEIRNYGWASAVPDTKGDPKIRWNPGYGYTYKLNYSNGIGVQDPADAFPGRAIIAPIEVTGTGTTWHTVTDFEEDVLHLDVQK